MPAAYTPGCLGTVASPYGTGYSHSPWVGTVWYPPPYTYGVAAAPIYNPYVSVTYGLALGLATAAWTEHYWGGAYDHRGYYGGYPCCASASARTGNTNTRATAVSDTGCFTRAHFRSQCGLHVDIRERWDRGRDAHDKRRQ